MIQEYSQRIYSAAVVLPLVCRGFVHVCNRFGLGSERRN